MPTQPNVSLISQLWPTVAAAVIAQLIRIELVRASDSRYPNTWFDYWPYAPKGTVPLTAGNIFAAQEVLEYLAAKGHIELAESDEEPTWANAASVEEVLYYEHYHVRVIDFQRLISEFDVGDTDEKIVVKQVERVTIRRNLIFLEGRKVQITSSLRQAVIAWTKDNRRVQTKDGRLLKSGTTIGRQALMANIAESYPLVTKAKLDDAIDGINNACRAKQLGVSISRGNEIIMTEVASSEIAEL